MNDIRSADEIKNSLVGVRCYIDDRGVKEICTESLQLIINLQARIAELEVQVATLTDALIGCDNWLYGKPNYSESELKTKVDTALCGSSDEGAE